MGKIQASCISCLYIQLRVRRTAAAAHSTYTKSLLKIYTRHITYIAEGNCNTQLLFTKVFL